MEQKCTLFWQNGMNPNVTGTSQVGSAPAAIVLYPEGSGTGFTGNVIITG